MAGTRKSKQVEIKDEPGAEDRFKRILGKALNTPPPHKQGDVKRKKVRKAAGKS